MEEVNHEDNTRIVTQYIMGASGEWKSEILEHPDPFGVGVVQVWDREKFYTYYPMIDTVSIRSNYAKNERVRPNPMLGTVLSDNIKRDGKMIKVDKQTDVYSNNILITGEVNKYDQENPHPSFSRTTL